MQKRCDIFEGRQSAILRALDGKTGRGGNLIAPIDFFIFDGSYYKVTEKIDSKGLDPGEIVRLPRDAKLIILRSAANSLRILHQCGIVHGDIKLDNILIRRRADGTLTASLIDFDDSYFEGKPPLPPEEFVMDPPYGAPEVFRFVMDSCEREAAALSRAADVFSLGLVFCEYLSGAKPATHGSKSRYAGEALLQGGSLTLPAKPDWEREADLIRKMLSIYPAKRPTLSQVLELCGSPGAGKEPSSSKLLIKLGGTGTPPPHGPASEGRGEPAGAHTGKLVINLGPKTARTPEPENSAGPPARPKRARSVEASEKKRLT